MAHSWCLVRHCFFDGKIFFRKKFKIVRHFKALAFEDFLGGPVGPFFDFASGPKLKKAKHILLSFCWIHNVPAIAENTFLSVFRQDIAFSFLLGRRMFCRSEIFNAFKGIFEAFLPNIFRAF